MGMFTRIRHPKDGRELQIKCGYDEMDEYSVGDTVDWYIDPGSPGSGKLLDGAYGAYDDDFVIIKDHKVVAVEPRKYKGTVLSEGYYERKWDIVPYERSWWTESAWAKKQLKEKRYELKRVQEDIGFLEMCVGKTDAEIAHMRTKRFGHHLVEALKEQMNYEGFARQIFNVIPIENKCESK